MLIPFAFRHMVRQLVVLGIQGVQIPVQLANCPDVEDSRGEGLEQNRIGENCLVRRHCKLLLIKSSVQKLFGCRIISIVSLKIRDQRPDLGTL